MATLNQVQTAANIAYGDGSGSQTLGTGWKRIPDSGDKGVPIAQNTTLGY